MKVLVTGASGFIGKNALLKFPRDWEIVAVYYRDESFPQFIEQHGLHHVKPLRVDLSDRAALDKVDATFKSYDACVYLAANGDPAYSQHEPVKDLTANTYALLNTVTAWKFGHVIYFSSGAVYDRLEGAVNPSSTLCPALPYAISKWAAERYVFYAKKQGNVGRVTIARFFGAYGPYEAERKIYGRLIKQFAKARDPQFSIRGDGKNLIDAMYVDDTIQGIQLLLQKSKEDEVLDFYSGAPLTLSQLVETAGNTFQLAPQIAYTGEVPEYIQFYSNDKTMEQKYGFKPTISLPQGLRQFYSWIYPT